MAGRWLLKTEPQEWSWEHQHANGGVSHWDGVRNAQAQKNLRTMAKGDLCFFYHSGSKAKEIVGIARVCKTFYPDPSDPAAKHGMIDIEAVSKLVNPLPLSRLKQEDGLNSFIMFRQPRLSVVPVDSLEWKLICELAGEFEPPLPVKYDPARSKGSNGDSKAGSLLSKDDGKQELQSSDGKVWLTRNAKEIPPSEENAGFRASFPEQIVRSFIEEVRVNVTVHARSRQEGAEARSSIDGSRAKSVGEAEELMPRYKSRAADGEREVGQDGLEDHSSDSKLAPDGKQVYSRRKRKLWQLEHNAETSTHPDDDMQLDAEQVRQVSMLAITETMKRRPPFSDAGKVYKRRDGKKPYF